MLLDRLLEAVQRASVLQREMLRLSLKSNFDCVERILDHLAHYASNRAVRDVFDCFNALVGQSVYCGVVLFVVSTILRIGHSGARSEVERGARKDCISDAYNERREIISINILNGR